MRAVYDTIGTGYAAKRQADPRIARAIRAALGDAANVVYLGAGAGSYEPSGLRVVAVEPSWEMIGRRPTGRAPVVQAGAERLPFPDGVFDAALAVLTVHHWNDRPGGLAELTDCLGGRIETQVLPVPHDCADGFLGAFWRRPNAYLDPAVRGAMSCFAQLPPGRVAAGLTRLAEDLSEGRWTARFGDLRESDSADLGYRVVVADLGRQDRRRR